MYRFNIFIGLLIIINACTYTVKIKDGTTAYERAQYAVAIPYLQKEIKKTKSRAQKGKLEFMLAESYRLTGEYEKSLPWYKSAYDNSYGTIALKEYAYGLKRAERYDEALEMFKILSLEIGSRFEFRKDMEACTLAQEWLSTPNAMASTTSPIMPTTGDHTDFAPVAGPNKSIYIVSDRAASSKSEQYAWTNRGYMNIYQTDADFSNFEPFESPISSAYNEGPITFSKDYKELYFSRCDLAVKDKTYCILYKSERTVNGWSDPQPLDFQTDEVNYIHPVLSPDGKQLFFSSDSKEGWGGYDLYVSERTESGWDFPKPLSRAINTDRNEVFPTWYDDTLYFSSEGHLNMGSLDIFKSYPIGENGWAVPQNLKPPINSGADDFGILFTKSTSDGILEGYLSSNRLSATDAIFEFKQLPPPPPPVPIDTVVFTPTYEYLLDIYVLENIYENPSNPQSRILGRRTLNGATVQMDRGISTTDFPTITKDDEPIHLQIKPGEEYQFTVSAAEHLAGIGFYSAKDLVPDPTHPIQRYELEITLENIFRNQEIVLDDIYYDFNKWDIRDDAKPTLNKLATLLAQNPTVTIELGSHTDCRGKLKYNQELSQKRAESAVSYLISRGIASSRLTATGYGESNPAVLCDCTKCTEAEHQMNRRTSFKILD